MSETCNTIYDMPDLKRWWEGSPLDKALTALDIEEDREVGNVAEPLGNSLHNTALELSVNIWDPVLCNWERVWSVWKDEDANYIVVFDDPTKTITSWSKIEINWKEAEIVNDGNVISLVWNLNEVEVVADSLFNGIKPRPAKPIEINYWNEYINPITSNRDSILNLDNMYWIKVWDIVFVEWERVWQVWFNETIWLHVDFDENHKTIEDNKKVTIWWFEFKILQKWMLSPLVTLPEVAVIDSPIENGERTLLRLEDITVYLWKDLNTDILIDTINDLANNGTEEQKTKIGKLKAILWDKSKNSDWSSPMVESFQKNELSITNQWADWKFWVKTFEKTKQWLGILPNGWIKTWKVEDYNWLKEIYKVRGKNLIDKTANTINTFSNQIGARFDIKQNIMVQNRYGLKNFVLFNDWKIKIPDEFASIINWKDAEGKVYDPQKDDKWNVMCDWECGLNEFWKPCINISQNNVSLYSIPFDYIA